MSERRSILQRLRRILELTERLLEERIGSPASADVFRETMAFRWVASGSGSSGAPGRLQPVPDYSRFELDDLIGVEPAIEHLIRNTEQFLAGHPSNHVLLYGERGTGKSSAVRGLLSRYGEKGLRMVEVRRDDLLHLPDVLGALRGAPQRFLLFCDDLSFGDGDSGYRELKAALEGSLEGPPANVRIIATSNRRHLLPERHHENQQIRVDEQGELRLGEAIDEKLALSDRFGLVLGFFGFDQATYLRIVAHHLDREGVGVRPEEVREEALRWALDRSSRSGRTARQFVDDFVGKRALEAGR